MKKPEETPPEGESFTVSEAVSYDRHELAAAQLARSQPAVLRSVSGACPRCGSQSVSAGGGMRHCNDCGTTFAF